MGKLLLLLIVTLLLIILLCEGGKQRPKKIKDQSHKHCGKWTFDKCVPNNATNGCGKGTKVGVRNGTECKNTKKTFPCFVKCSTGRTNKHKKCEYGRWQFSECDEVSNKVTGTKTLMRGDASCEPTITTTKKCRRTRKSEKKNKKMKMVQLKKAEKQGKKDV